MKNIIIRKIVGIEGSGVKQNKLDSYNFHCLQDTEKEFTKEM